MRAEALVHAEEARVREEVAKRLKDQVGSKTLPLIEQRSGRDSTMGIQGERGANS